MAPASFKRSNGALTITFDTPVDVIAPLRGPCPVSNVSCAWLTVNGVNTTATSTADGSVSVPAPSSGRLSVQYLQGDWPVPFIYAQGVPAPGLPAAPFSITVN